MKSNKQNGRRSNGASSSSGVPKEMRVRLPTYFFVSQATNGIDDGVAMLNSAFDPGQALSAQQPTGFDQLAALYNRYQVLGCDVEITLIDQDTNATNGQYSVAVSNDSTAFTSFAQASSQPRSVTHGVLRSIYGEPKVIPKFHVSIPDVLGVTMDHYIAEEAQYGAAVTADPSQTVFLHLLSLNFAGASKVVSWQVKLTQTIRFYDRVQLALS